MVELHERTYSSKKVQFKKAPVSVHILLLICALYLAVQVLMLLCSVFFSMDDNFVYSFISGVLALVPWTGILVAGAFGLWKRKVWGWAIWLVTSFWFISANISYIHILILNLLPRFEIIAYFVFVLLLTPGVRKWCKVDFNNAFPPIFAVLTFFIGWIWCSVILYKDFLPPDIAEINSFMVICSIVCWLFYWVAAYSIAKGKMYGVILSVVASALSMLTLVVALLAGWFGLQQRVLWAFSTIYGKAGLWISVRDSLSLLGVILIAVNLITAIMLIVFRKKILMKNDLAIENIKSKEVMALEVEEKAIQDKLLKCVLWLLFSVPVIFIGGVFITSTLDLHTTVAKSEALPNYLQFSPNGKTVAYLWRDATYYHSWTPSVRPRTMTDALEVRWFPVGASEDKKSIPLDSINLRPDGQTYYNLDGGLCFSPDSQNLAAVCANYIIIINIETGDYNKLHYDGEWFDSLRWLSEQEIVFSTKYDKKTIFWRFNITDIKDSRTKIHEWERSYPISDELPPGLQVYRFSPNAKFVFFTITHNNDLAVKLLNLETGQTRIFPISLCNLAWKPDGTKLLLYLFDEKKFYLVKTETMEITELTEQFLKNIGKPVDIDHIILSSLWTPDGKYVVFSVLEKVSSQRNPFHKYTGYLVQLDPFKIIFSKKQHQFNRSPIPGWIFIREGDTFNWVDYAGNGRVTMKEWVPDLVWSPDATHAAKIQDGKVVIFKPTLPSN